MPLLSGCTLKFCYIYIYIFHFHLLKHIYVQTYIDIQNMMQNQSSGVFFMLLKAYKSQTVSIMLVVGRPVHH